MFLFSMQISFGDLSGMLALLWLVLMASKYGPFDHGFALSRFSFFVCVLGFACSSLPPDLSLPFGTSLGGFFSFPIVVSLPVSLLLFPLNLFM